MHFIEELASTEKLLCPDTGTPVRARDGRLISASGRDLGSVAGPLDFLKGHRKTLDVSQVPAADVERLRAHLELPATPEVTAQIAAAIAATGIRFDDAHLSAEARMLAERFRIPEFALGDAPAAKIPTTIDRLAASFGRAFSKAPRAGYRIEHLSNSIGERLSAGQAVYRSVRVRNASDAPLQMEGDGAATIETRWTEAASGAIAETAATSNAIPVDIEPGREITLILRVRAPAASGQHTLHAGLAISGKPVEPPFLAATVEIVPCELPVFEYEYFPTQLEYGADHHFAMLEAAQFLEARYGGQPVSMLEIGGGVHPTAHALALRGHRVVSSDISHSESILGSLHFRHKMPQLDESLAFISCEGTTLPFAGETFDGVMLFAAFHHFADPIALLHEMRRVSRPGGFVFLGCESCAPDPANKQYREELSRGINEQTWTLAEFTQFFRAAGLKVVRARVDSNSLKVGLAWS